MPTLEEHRAALAKAQAAGDSAAVAEIQQAIAEASAQQPYDKKIYQGALSKAWTAKDVPAVVEIADDWMSAADAAGKRSPMQYTEDELRDRYNDAVKAGDNEGVILLSVAAKRKGVNLGDNLASFTRSLARGADKIGGAVAALPGAALDVAENTGRGVARLASGEKSVGDLGAAIADNALTMARSIPGAEYVEAGGGQIVNLLEGEGLTSGLVEEARAAQEEQAARNPMAAMAGQIAGAGAVANRVAKAPGLGLAPQAGVPGNIAKTAAIGGVTEGAVGLADTGNLQEAANRAATGAILTPVATAVVKPIIQVAAPAARAITGNALPSGMKKLSQVVKIPVRELEAARVQLKQARGGQNPSIAEIVDTATIQRTQQVIASQPRVAKAAQTAAETGELNRPTRLAEIVEDGKPVGSSIEVTAAQKKLFDDAMATHGGRPVVFNNPSFLNKRAVHNALNTLADNADPQTAALLRKFQDAIENGNPAQVRLRDIENIRVALSDAITANPSLTEALKPVRVRLNQIAGNQIPEYGQVLQQYGALGDIATGVDEGAAAVGGSSEAARATRATSKTGAQNRGQEVGFRTGLSEKVGGSYGNSTRAAEQLENPALVDRASTMLGPQEAQRIAQAGALEAKAGRNLDQLNPAPNPMATRPQGDMALTLDGFAAMGPAGAGYRANTLLKIVDRLRGFGMRPETADKLAKALFDPAQSEQAVEILQKIGKYNDIELLLATELAAGLQAGE